MGAGIAAVRATEGSFWPQIKPVETQKKSTHFGHTYRVVSEKFNAVVDTMSLTDGLQYLAQFVVGAMVVMRAVGVRTINVLPATTKLGEAITYIDCIRTYTDFDEFISGRAFEDWRRSHFAGVLSSTLFLGSSLGGCANTAALFKLIDLKKVSASLSQFSVFGFRPYGLVAGVTLGRFCLVAGTGAYLFGAIDSLIKIQEGNHSKSRLAYLAYCTAALAMQIFVIATEAVATVSAVAAVGGVLAMISAGCGAVWIYQSHLENVAAAKKLAL